MTALEFKNIGSSCCTFFILLFHSSKESGSEEESTKKDAQNQQEMTASAPWMNDEQRPHQGIQAGALYLSFSWSGAVPPQHITPPAILEKTGDILICLVTS